MRPSPAEALRTLVLLTSFLALPSAGAELQKLAPPAKEQPPLTLSLLTGSSLHINGYNYNLGVGVRAGLELGPIYLGAMVAVHQGDTHHITWGPVPALGIKGGLQQYSSLPVFAVADAGYALTLPVGAIEASLTPYLSAGLLTVNLSTSGVYGESTLVHPSLVVGGGFSTAVRFLQHYGVGLHFRVYNAGDTKFAYGNLSEGTVPHGFSTSIFYAAFYSELSYRF